MTGQTIRVRATTSFSWEYELDVAADETPQQRIEMEEQILQEEEPVDTSVERYVNNKGWCGGHEVTVELVED